MNGFSAPRDAEAVVLHVLESDSGGHKFGLYFDLGGYETGDHCFDNVSGLNRLLESFLLIDKEKNNGGVVDLRHALRAAHDQLDRILKTKI